LRVQLNYESSVYLGRGWSRRAGGVRSEEEREMV
jgi:hypothetical protein